MKKVPCRRCGTKIAANPNGNGSIEIKCHNCKAINHVTLDKSFTVAG